MTKSISYDRPKSTTINSTGIVFTVKAAEKPNTSDYLPSAGSTAELDVRIMADADESGGSDVQEMFQVDVKPGLANTANGVVTLTITATPVNGDGSLGTTQTLTVTHPQSMDAWQTAAGRARQA